MSSEKDKQLQDRVRALVSSLMKAGGSRAMLFEEISNAGYKVFDTPQSLAFTPDEGRLEGCKRGIILDVETMGLDWKTDKVIQICMIEFFYDDEGIIQLGEVFDRLVDPGKPIPAEITELTGITDDMVAGKTLADAEIAEFLVAAESVTAHHANFDRKMVEKNFPRAGFDKIDWHCSIEQIDWKSRGVNSPKLELIAMSQGFVYDAHNAKADVEATAHILMNTANDSRPAILDMLEAGKNGRVMILATDSPFERKDDLKDAGYRWDGDMEHHDKKGWWKTIPNEPEALDAEAETLRAVYGREVSVPCYRMGAEQAYSNRKGDVDRFRTAEVNRPEQMISQETGSLSNF
jgi:DNA polymerase-3 subunit epsilon